MTFCILSETKSETLGTVNFSRTASLQKFKSDSLWGPSEIEKMWHKVGKMEPLIFRP